jgi:hypothetical protein
MELMEVRDGLRTVQFKGEKLSESDTEKQLPAGASWPDDIDPKDWKSHLRWIRMELFAVAPDPAIGLPDGGYFYHIERQTVCYHVHQPSCGWKGVPKLAGSIKDTDLLPCPLCRPPMLWDPDPEDPDYVLLLVDPMLTVDVEPVRHDLIREATAEGLVYKVESPKLTQPAALLLEIARERDPAIAAVFRTSRA